MRLEQFYYLLSLKQTKSMNTSAEILHISQQAISSAIKSLEKELGAQLLIRTVKGVQLTECGYYACECGEKIVDALDILKKNVTENQSCILRKPLTIMIHSSFALYSNNLIVSLYNTFPDYELNTITCQNHVMLRKIIAHDADLALCYTFKQGLKDIQQAGLYYQKIETFQYGVLINSNSPLSQYDSIPLAEVVKRYPIMIFNDLESDNNSVNELLQKHNLQHLAKYAAVNITSMRHMLENDLAVAMGPQNIYSKAMEKAAYGIDCKFIPFSETELFYCVLFANPQLDRSIIKRFKNILKQMTI